MNEYAPSRTARGTRLFLFEFLYDVLQERAHRKMLRTDLFSFAAAEAIGRFAAFGGVYRAVIVVRVSIVVNLLRIQECKQIGNGDVLRANLRAVAARGARNQIHRMINCLHLFDRGALGFIQRLKILHKVQIVVHLIEIAHAGKRHHHAREARGESDCIAASVQVVEYFFSRNPEDSRGERP